MADLGPRYPISVRVSGVLLHEKTKLYMSQVLWSDQNNIAVYRSFEEFNVIHKRMKKIFPPANALTKSDRTIPKFRDVKMKGKRVKKKGASRSVLRCKLLEKYCNDLLSCDPRVTQNSELTQFFHPRDQDLQHDFTKNSVMIVPSDEVEGQGGGGRAHVNHATNITQPFVTETYRCVAAFDTKDTKNRAFKVAVDERLDVLIKDQAGWWLVENENKNMAWFPAPYLEKVVDDDGGDYEEDDVDSAQGGGTEYIAVRTYKATKGDELSVEIGTQVEVLQKSDNGWWLIRHKGKVGYVPTLFLQPYTNPCNRMTQMHSSSLDLSSRPSASPPGVLQHSHSLEIPENHQRVPGIRLPSSSSSSNELLLPPAAVQRSRSLSATDMMPGAHQLQFVISRANTSLGGAGSMLPVGASTPVGRRAHLPTSPTTPVITVEMDDGGDRRWTGQAQVDSEDSFGSDSSEFSISGQSSDSADSNFNLSYGDHAAADEPPQQQRLSLSYNPPPTGRQSSLSYNPPPTGRRSRQTTGSSGGGSHHLSPNSGGPLMPATSDPSLYKRPTSPRVPPRPKAQEILTRCSTVTRKNLSRAGSPAPMIIT